MYVSRSSLVAVGGAYGRSSGPPRGCACVGGGGLVLWDGFFSASASILSLQSVTHNNNKKRRKKNK